VLLVASSNAGKIAEFRLGVRLWMDRMRRVGLPAEWTVEPVPGMDALPCCVEDGETFAINARKKALHYSRCVSGLVMGDDSGLEVEALGGAPGVWSRRYAGPEATDARNNEKLLHEMRRVPAANRAARFVCVLALASAEQPIAEFRGEARGVLLDSPRGGGGFGYDPLFLDPVLNKAFAELSAEEKLERSHRGQALRAMLEWLARNRDWCRRAR